MKWLPTTLWCVCAILSACVVVSDYTNGKSLRAASACICVLVSLVNVVEELRKARSQWRPYGARRNKFMSDNSEIQWCDASWNPTRGCTKISPGCRSCYAEAFAERFRGAYQTRPDPNVPKVEGKKRPVIQVVDADGRPVPHAYHDGFDPRLAPEMLDLPLTWKKPKTIFVDSMSDLFMAEVPYEYIDQVFAVQLLSPRHTFQTLTKRSHRMMCYFKRPELYERILEAAREFRNARPELLNVGISDPRTTLPPWIWLGVSVEDKKYGLPRIEHLRRVPAALRFLSIEPLLENLGTLDLTGISWVIVGGESGINARECELDWIRDVVIQCRRQAVPVFVKQLGARATDAKNGIAGKRLFVDTPMLPLVSKRLQDFKGGDMAEWPEDLRVRQMPPTGRA